MNKKNIRKEKKEEEHKTKSNNTGISEELLFHQTVHCTFDMLH
jgi:hypothetical protein